MHYYFQRDGTRYGTRYPWYPRRREEESSIGIIKSKFSVPVVAIVQGYKWILSLLAQSAHSRCPSTSNISDCRDLQSTSTMSVAPCIYRIRIVSRGYANMS